MKALRLSLRGRSNSGNPNYDAPMRCVREGEGEGNEKGETTMDSDTYYVYPAKEVYCTHSLFLTHLQTSEARFSEHKS